MNPIPIFYPPNTTLLTTNRDGSLRIALTTTRIDPENLHQEITLYTSQTNNSPKRHAKHLTVWRHLDELAPLSLDNINPSTPEGRQLLEHYLQAAT